VRAYVRVWVCLHACAPQQICNTMLLPYGASVQDVLSGHVHVHSVGARKTSQLDATHWAAEVRWSLPTVPLSIPNSYRTGTARHNRNLCGCGLPIAAAPRLHTCRAAPCRLFRILWLDCASKRCCSLGSTPLCCARTCCLRL
jgi:hypothetical protein